MYQLYFYINLFDPLEDSSIINEKSLNKWTIEKLVNEILMTDRQENRTVSRGEWYLQRIEKWN